MRKMTKFRRSVKGISPVISVLLMIAIAVAASLVAYAWVMGYMDFTTTKVGKTIQIQSVSTNAVYVQNIGDSPVTITDVFIDGDLTTAYTMDPTNGVLNPSDTATIDFTATLPTPQVTIKVVTSDGISAEYTETFP
jgi:flagellin-like protein